MAERADLVVVNKFGPLEAGGGGLRAETLEALAEGLPLLVAVAADHLAAWLELCGGSCDLLAPDPDALWRWWGPRRLWADLVLGVEDGPVARLVVGRHWTLVQGPHGVGLAHSPVLDGLPDLAPFTGLSLRALAGLVDSWDPLRRAVGMAALNAAYNRFDLQGREGNGLDVLGRPAGRMAVVGSFPGIAERLPGCHVLDLAPGPGEYPGAAAESLLPGADQVLITASAAVNGTLGRLLELAWGARVAVVGPGTPLSPRLFDLGIEALAGVVASDPDGLAATVAQGGGVRAIKPYCRSLVLTA